jgi:hypothetical protein
MVRVRMPIQYNQYWICADDVSEDDANAIDIAPGLAQWQPGEVIVTAADQDRSLDVEIVLLDEPPTAGVKDPWLDSVEFSIETTTGEIRLIQLMDGPRGPNLAVHGPGGYRLRLSASGRDPIAGKKPREQHRLEVWSAPVADPAVLRLTSKFAIGWAAEPLPPREIDWTALAGTKGIRLIVGWMNLQAPSDPDLLSPTTVTVSDVLEGTPAQVFSRFQNQVVGGLAGGMRTAGSIAETRTFNCFVINDLYFPDEVGHLTDIQRYIGNLAIVGEVTDSDRFKSFSMAVGFEDDFAIPDGTPQRRHPIPPGSSTLTFDFSKHPDGRHVAITHSGVQAWLADDVAALWQMVLERNRRYSKYRAAMPWDNYETSYDD